MSDLTIKVQNGGFYSRTAHGTWNELVEEMALKLESWNTYSVDRSENRNGIRHDWGTLYDEEGRPVYTFWATYTDEWGEVEITRLTPENE